MVFILVEGLEVDRGQEAEELELLPLLAGSVAPVGVLLLEDPWVALAAVCEVQSLNDMLALK